jgi:predicted transcriptional regulator of viral defense system
MPRTSTLTTLADLAEGQGGLFTRRQAEQTGMAWTTLSRLVRSGIAGRIAHGVYRLRAGSSMEWMDLHAAWLQLAPGTPMRSRTASQGVVSHRSAAALHGLGDLPADRHHFITPTRRQSRRKDVRIREARLREGEWQWHTGLLVTTPARTAADLLSDMESLQAVGRVARDAVEAAHVDPAAIAAMLAPQAKRLRFDGNDGQGLLDWLLSLAG